MSTHSLPKLPKTKSHLTSLSSISIYIMKIGNCIFLGKPKSKPRVEKTKKHSKVVHIVKLDGKIIEVKSPTTAENFLLKFPGLNLSISLKPSQFLPATYELRNGNTYYLVPIPKKEQKQCVKKIKVVITKKQLQELLAKQKPVEEVLLGLKIKSVDNDYSPYIYSTMKSKLETIPEEVE